MRINRFLAAAGLGSRRHCEDLIRKGKVRINGAVVKDLSTMIRLDTDEVLVGKRKVELEDRKVILIMRKPKHVISSVTDTRGRKTVIDLARERGYRQRLFSVGRLDFDTAGLLLLTNDGDLAYRLTHPRFKIEKTYRVTVRGKVSDETMTRISSGVLVQGYKTKPCLVSLIESSNERSILEVRLREGRKRQIRFMFSKFGHHVERLERVAIADLEFNDVPMGGIRPLTFEEETRLKRLTGLTTEKEE